MEKFLLKLKNAARSLFGKGECTAHQVNLFTWPLIVGVAFNAFAGWFGGLVMIYVLGIIMEMTYWFVPYKTVKVFGLHLQIPDYSKIRDVRGDMPLPEGRRVDLDDFYYTYLSMAIFLAYKLLTLFV